MNIYFSATRIATVNKISLLHKELFRQSCKFLSNIERGVHNEKLFLFTQKQKFPYRNINIVRMSTGHLFGKLVRSSF